MGDRRKCQTYAASPAEPGGLPVMLERMRRQRAERKHRDCGDRASKREGMNPPAAAPGQGTRAKMQPGFRREFS